MRWETRNPLEPLKSQGNRRLSKLEHRKCHQGMKNHPRFLDQFADTLLKLL